MDRQFKVILKQKSLALAPNNMRSHWNELKEFFITAESIECFIYLFIFFFIEKRFILELIDELLLKLVQTFRGPSLHTADNDT